ncbi:hypothetical protein H6F67_03755 [Microcoleus sp. FACHB-1515]|uniref:hypothetical protein n=1 Tax=Cyanophyceae TaxID=3028117 RepID=UPI0016826BF6|nr:hypothetical protein [Microcoleus sp. FACHB-1515]MBD2088967.1 hypothetical protein [Microcoleus sp. FACHB-1515]
MSRKLGQLHFDRASPLLENILSEQKGDRFLLGEQFALADELGAATGCDKWHRRSINSAAA